MMCEHEFEKLSEEIHKLYCKQYELDNGKPYWTNGDYSKLDERTKEYDRNIARWHLQQLTAARDELAAEKAARENAEAQCAAMREALTEIMGRCEIPKSEDDAHYENYYEAKEALDGTAGTAILAELQRYRSLSASSSAQRVTAGEGDAP